MAFTDLIKGLDAAQLAVFGTPTTYQPYGGSPVPVRGIFDAAYVDVDPSGGFAGISSVKPMIFYRLADLPSDPDTDDPTITVNGVVYELSKVEPDGQGGVRLILHTS